VQLTHKATFDILILRLLRYGQLQDVTMTITAWVHNDLEPNILLRTLWFYKHQVVMHTLQQYMFIGSADNTKVLITIYYKY